MAAARLGLVELDLLATHAGASIPYPLRVPSFGRIAGERDELFAMAGETLRLRDLADEDGPVGLAAELVAALTNRRGTVDVVITGSDGPVAVVAIVHGHRALLCRQTPQDAADLLVDVRHVALDDLVEVLVGLVPPLPGTKTMPVCLPTAGLRAAHELVTSGEPNLEHRLYDVIAEHGGRADDLDALLAAADGATGGGQAGATRRSALGMDVRAGAELSWLDTPRGRLRVGAEPTRGGHEWLSANPLRPHDLHVALAKLVELARGR